MDENIYPLPIFLEEHDLACSVMSKGVDFGFGFSQILTSVIACCYFSESNIRADAARAILHHRFQPSLKTVILQP